VIVHWPPPKPSSAQQSLPVRHSHSYESARELAAPLQVAEVIGIGEALQIGLAGVSIIQAQLSASQGSFTLTYPQAQRLLTPEARATMPTAQAKHAYSAPLLHLAIGALIPAAEADVIIEWEGNDYGEIGTPVIRRRLETSTEWSKSSANIAIALRETIPPQDMDPRAWPIVYSYEGTYDPYGNGYFEFTGEFEINAFGGLHFNRHKVVTRSMADFAIGGQPEDKVARGRDIVVPIPAMPADQQKWLHEHPMK
jgi:hypothetical protein